MLALTRRVNDDIMVVTADNKVIGRIIVTDVRGLRSSQRPSVKLAFDFLPEYKLWRGELWKNGVMGDLTPGMDAEVADRSMDAHPDGHTNVIDSEVA